MDAKECNHHWESGCQSWGSIYRTTGYVSGFFASCVFIKADMGQFRVCVGRPRDDVAVFLAGNSKENGLDDETGMIPRNMCKLQATCYVANGVDFFVCCAQVVDTVAVASGAGGIVAMRPRDRDLELYT